MDRRLLEAALTGDVHRLRQLLLENPLILHTTSLISAAENPLQVASLAGHLDFCKEVLQVRPDFAKELNQDGFSAVHVAAANGYPAVLKEMLRTDPSLCSLKGSQEMTPLHCAAGKGRVEVILEMLLAGGDCILEEVNIRKETALHLAVRTGQLEAVRVLVEWVRKVRKESLLNAKDRLGNTILHLATWRKQRQVIEILLAEGIGSTASQAMEVNAINKAGLTALDMILIFPSEAGDLEVGELLRHAGAQRAQDMTSSLMPLMPETVDNNCCGIHTSLLYPDDLLEYFKFHRGRDSPSEARSALLVIAVLVATATYQVGINPPGGVWQDNTGPYLQNNSSKTVRFAGKSIMATYSTVWFCLFVLFNSLGFYLSLYMINVLTRKFPLQLELQICLMAMMITYNIAVVSVAPEGKGQIFMIVLTAVFPTMVPLATKITRKFTGRIYKLMTKMFRVT